MKNLTTLLLLVGISSSSYANCIQAYENAAFKRETNTQFLVVAGVVALAVTAAVLSDNEQNNSSNNRSNNERNRRDRLRNQNRNMHNYHGNNQRRTHVHQNYHVNHSYYSHTRYNHERYHHHYHQSYGYYYVSEAPADQRWLGDNKFDKVLAAYNDATVAFNNDVTITNSSYLNDLNKLVAKKVVRLSRRARKKDKVRDIKSAKTLVSVTDRALVRDMLISGMEDTSSDGFCSDNSKVLTRTKIVKKLAQAVLATK
jgi:Ni/Co efflux regulator RcnB